jgi:hypothetical protein
MPRRSRKALETLTTSPLVREAAAALINAVREESLARMVTSEAYTRAVDRWEDPGGKTRTERKYLDSSQARGLRASGAKQSDL